MKSLTLLFLGLTVYLMCGKCSENNVTNLLETTNVTDPNQDMYVIHATVYQIGILTNNTDDNMTDNFNSTGNQESLTLYHTNGTNVDLSQIPEPFLTNVTAQTLVGVAPIPPNTGENHLNAWSALDQITHPATSQENDGTSGAKEVMPLSEGTSKRSADYTNFFLRLFKRDVTNSTPVRVVEGSAEIPPAAGIQSISLPLLMSLNNNLTEIPVPIPNTSVVHYAKVNTLVQKP